MKSLINRKSMRVFLLAPLLFLGVGCGKLFDQYTLGDDYDDDLSGVQKQYYKNELKKLDDEAAAEAEARRIEAEKAEAQRPAPSKTYSEFAAMTPDEIRWAAPIMISVLTLDGEMFPFPGDQFRKAEPDQCAEEHYHGAVGYTLALKQVQQPETPCGFGSAVSLEVVDTDAFIKWMQEGPKAKR